MKTIQVRNVPDQVHRELRIRATADGKSLSDYVLEELRNVASRPRTADVLRRARARSIDLDTAAIVDAVRSGRDRD